MVWLRNKFCWEAIGFAIAFLAGAHMAVAQEAPRRSDIEVAGDEIQLARMLLN